jgi:hypothetical protein
MSVTQLTWRHDLNKEVERLLHQNNSQRYAGGWGYTPQALVDQIKENARIEAWAQEQVKYHEGREMANLELERITKENTFRNYLLAVPYYKDELKEILDRYGPIFKIHEGSLLNNTYAYLKNCHAKAIIRINIAKPMEREIRTIFRKIILEIKNINIYLTNEQIDRCYSRSQKKYLENGDIDIGYENAITEYYKKDTDLDKYTRVDPRNNATYSTYDTIMKCIDIIHYAHEFVTYAGILVERGIQHEFLNYFYPPREDSLDVYRQIGRTYIHIFINPQVSKELNVLRKAGFARMCPFDFCDVQEAALNAEYTIKRIDALCEEQAKIQEESDVDAEVERRWKEEEFKKKVEVKLAAKRETQLPMNIYMASDEIPQITRQI